MRQAAFIILILVLWLATYNAPAPKAPVQMDTTILASRAPMEAPVSHLGLSR